MPKIKSNRGAAKRFRRTGTGAIKRRRAFRNHILTKKAPKRKNQLARSAYVNERDHANIDKLLD
jgi:large subunit ribosomal protein L35